MKDILTKEEMNSLLKAIDKGDIVEDERRDQKMKIKQYDFRRPIKLSREYVDTLYMIFDNFSKMAGLSLSNQTLSNVEIKTTSIEQINFDEFLRSISPLTVISVFKSEPLLSNQVIAFDPMLSKSIIEKMCGSSSKNSSAEKNIVSFTDIELGIMEEITLSTLHAFETAWKDVVEINTENVLVGSTQQVIQMVSPNEPIILITFDLFMNKHKNTMNICIPYISFDTIMDRLSLRNRFSSGRNISQNDELITKHLMGVGLDIEVILGKSIITVEDLLDLDSGDIIQLDIKTEDSLGLFVEKLKYFNVAPGVIEDKFAVEILDTIENDES